MFHELLSRDREDGRATASTIAEFGLRIENLLKSSQKTREQMAKSELLVRYHKLQFKIRDPKSQIRDRSRGVAERYVAGTETRGRQEERPYPWSQSRQGVNS